MIDSYPHIQISIEHGVALVIGLIIGGFVTWLIYKGKVALAQSKGIAAGDVERAMLTEQLKAANQTADDLRERLKLVMNECTALSHETTSLKSTIAELTTTIGAERTQNIEKLGLLNDARDNLSLQFKALANEILEEKARKFTEQNQVNLGQLLNPLKQQITDFKSKVEEVYVTEGKDRSALAEQVKQLMQLNTNLSQEAHNLTLALKGDSKAQGNWGEIILDDVLDKAGLQAGVHYQRQGSIVADDGTSRVIPDVVMHLPGKRHLIIDSKMTLPDYNLFTSSDDKVERSAALKKHLVSIRNHIKGLSEKKYQTLYNINSFDFVIMFVPLEPAFMVAVTNDPELFQNAWEKNVLLVSPSTLLFVVRTVAYLWRQEDQSRNAQDIANRGAELYDKLCGYVADLEDLGKQLGLAQSSYEKAKSKLHTGRGNLIRQADMLKTMGVKPTKALPLQLSEYAAAETEEDTHE